jgi:hypothetical protein
MTFTGMPTVMLYVQRATVKDWRTHPCDAGKTGTSCSSLQAIPPTNGSAQGSHSRKGTDHQREKPEHVGSADGGWRPVLSVGVNGCSARANG